MGCREAAGYAAGSASWRALMSGHWLAGTQPGQQELTATGPEARRGQVRQPSTAANRTPPTPKTARQAS